MREKTLADAGDAGATPRCCRCGGGIQGYIQDRNWVDRSMGGVLVPCFDSYDSFVRHAAGDRAKIAAPLLGPNSANEMWGAPKLRGAEDRAPGSGSWGTNGENYATDDAQLGHVR